MLPLDTSEMPEEFVHELAECRHNRDVLACLQAFDAQNQLAASLQQAQLRERRSVDGVGAPIAEITPDAYHYWGLREGYDCWRDKGFMREFLRDNPAARLKAAGTKTQVGFRAEPKPDFTGMAEVRTSRFRKVYRD